MEKIKFIFLECLMALVLVLVPLENNKGNGKSVVLHSFSLLIDPGHGGRDDGAVRDNVLEDEINLSISKKLYEKCIGANFVTYMSRIDDHDLSSIDSNNHKRDDLKKRADYINELGVDFFVSIHLNIYNSSTVFGPMVYYENNNEKSKLLATYVLEELNSFTNQNKKVHYEDYYLFRSTEAPGIIVECGFLSNDKERENLKKEIYQSMISECIFKGINAYIKNM